MEVEAFNRSAQLDNHIVATTLSFYLLKSLQSDSNCLFCVTVRLKADEIYGFRSGSAAHHAPRSRSGLTVSGVVVDTMGRCGDCLNWSVWVLACESLHVTLTLILKCNLLDDDVSSQCTEEFRSRDLLSSRSFIGLFATNFLCSRFMTNLTASSTVSTVNLGVYLGLVPSL